MQEAGANLQTCVADFWPEFARAGKASLTLAHVLSHRAGLCALEDASANMLDRGSVVRAIENQAPVLPVEAGPAYGPRVFGFLLDEILRRLTNGETLADYWRRVFAEPLGIDLWIGLPENENARVATILAPSAEKFATGEELFTQAFADADSLTRRAFMSPTGLFGISAMNFVFNLDATAKRFLSCGAASTKITKIELGRNVEGTAPDMANTTLPFADAELLVCFLSSQPRDMIKSRNICNR
jgi:CubicO group peptidase (beta-lactamase class C family)